MSLTVLVTSLRNNFMKHIAIKTTKRLIFGGFMAIAFLLVPTVFNYLSHTFQETYYQTSDLDNFFRTDSVVAEYMCTTETTQLIHSTRYVGIENGISAEITRELFQEITNSTGAVWAKIYEQRDVFVTIETEEVATRVQSYDKPLPQGKYYWQYKINKLYLPAGVVRTDTPLIKSNVFRVEDCVASPSAYLETDDYVSLAR